MTTATNLRQCVDCGSACRPQRHAPIPGTRIYGARGLCQNCWRRARYDGRLIDYPRRKFPRDELMAEWELLRAEGYTKRQAAGRLGVSWDALDRAFHRARRAGDLRALPPIGADARGRVS